MGTAFSSPWPVTDIFTTCRGTHPYPAPIPTPHCHTDNVLDQWAGVCEFSQFPSPLHTYIFPSKCVVPSTTKSFCGPTWLALASEMWTRNGSGQVLSLHQRAAHFLLTSFAQNSATPFLWFQKNETRMKQSHPGQSANLEEWYDIISHGGMVWLGNI